MKRIARILVTIVILVASTADAGSLRILTRDTSAIGGPALRHGRSFEERTGTQVTVTRIPFAELYDRIMIGFVTGQLAYDALLIPAAWLPDFAPYLAPVPDDILDSPVFQDIHPAYRDLMRWDDRWLALTIDGDLHMGTYRRDLFEDTGIRAAFAAAQGRSLRAPQTWAEYRDIAAFFSGRQAPDGTPLAGTLEAYARDGQRIWYLFSHAAAYANHPDHPGGMFFDPDTMVPAIDNPAWVRALQEFLDLERFGPADAAKLDSEAVRLRFADGRAAMDIDWADTGVLASDSRVSKVAGNLGFFPLPGSREVWNPFTKEWDRLREPRSVTFLAFGGWIAVVPADSPNQAQAWSYLSWYASLENSAADVLDGRSGINPYRRSHLDDPVPWRRLLGEHQGTDYLGVLRDSLSSRPLVGDLRIPGYRAYIAALETQLDRVFAGKTMPQEALTEAARTWEDLTDRLGRNSQRRQYRKAMGLEEPVE
jgi:multiple sugar transport system substrate-binding protein